MATVITTINGSDAISTSDTVINSNFSSLNSNKIETDTLDTDTALTANSDAKIATQKAVKTYVDAGGNVNASTTAKGIVEEATQAEVDAGTAAGATGARLFINPSTAPSGVAKSVTAGATINGATLPVPVYQNKTDNEFYACDGNDTAAMKFLGFAISNGTNGSSMNVKFSGIVSGFTGLDEGEKYYLSDTVGTIQNSPGTYEVLVGVAISTTELLIQKGKRFAAGAVTFSSTTTSAIVVGFRPTKVTVTAYGLQASTDAEGHSVGSWSIYDTAVCIYISHTGSTIVSGINTTEVWFAYRDGTGASHGNHGTITSVTDTGFTLSNTLEGTATAHLYWEAEGEL